MTPEPPDPYEILELGIDAELPAIRAAHRKLALKCYPDKGQAHSPERAARQDQSQRIQQAQELLTNNGTMKHDDKERLEESREAHRGSDPICTKATTARSPPLPSSPVEDDMERKDFVTFALKLFDETKRNKAPPLKHQVTSSTPKYPKHAPVLIEEETKGRNKGFQERKEDARGHASTAKAKGSSSAPVPVLKEKLYFVPDEQRNLKVMNPENEEAHVDIVAVHGLGAIPDITWTCRRKGSEEKINWLSDGEMLPKTAPKARILRFGYDSLWMGNKDPGAEQSSDPIRTSLTKIAIKLLLCLGIIRTDDMERPLIFIGHCFGGLVIERALNLAKMFRNKYPTVFDSSIGVVFLGTPHRGSNSFTRSSALLQNIAASSDISQHIDTSILETMTSDHGDLLDVADDFITACVEGGPKLACFYEQRSSKVGKIIGKNNLAEFIVDSRSACFDGHPKFGLEEDHFSLNKFDGPNNSSYIQVCAVIQGFYRAALERVAQMTTAVAAEAPILAQKDTTQKGRPRLENRRAHDRLTTPFFEKSKRKRRHRRETLSSSARESSNKLAMTKSRQRDTHPSMKDEDEVLRREVIKELHEEDARKKVAINNAQLSEVKSAAEGVFLQSLKTNMRRYGVDDPEAILGAHPLPKDEDLNSAQEIHDKDKWYKNHLKGVLAKEGLDGGQIDEILHNTGESAIINGMETACSKMAKKWVSTRTLSRYQIPWQYDENDATVIIVKRWVPDYEQDFIWDHSEALWETRGRRQSQDRERPRQETQDHPEAQGMAWLMQKYEAFKDKQKEMAKDKQRETVKDKQKKTVKDKQKKTDTGRRLHRRHSHSPGPSATMAMTRNASTESLRSAPDSERVADRRRNSRTLSSRVSNVAVCIHNHHGTSHQSSDLRGSKPKSKSNSAASTGCGYRAIRRDISIVADGTGRPCTSVGGMETAAEDTILQKECTTEADAHSH